MHQLIISLLQFTLCHVMKGNKPDFHNAMSSDTSKGMFDEFLKLLGSQYKPEAVKGADKYAPTCSCVLQYLGTK